MLLTRLFIAKKMNCIIEVEIYILIRASLLHESSLNSFNLACAAIIR